MSFDEWERKYLARRKEFDAWFFSVSSATNAETEPTKDVATEQPVKAPGVTASTEPRVWSLAKDCYVVLCGETLYLADTVTLRRWYDKWSGQ